MPKPGKDRPVLVTGASKGLGQEIALALANQGFRVWAGVRDPKQTATASAAAERNVSLRTVLLDVTSDESVAAAIRQIEEADGFLYGLVNNAGVTKRCCFEDFPEDIIRNIFEVNTFGAMRVTRRALPLLRRSGGRIVLISSIGGRIGSIAVAPYAASKFALEGFAESLALELKFFNIGVTIVEPGMVRTTIWDENRILPAAYDRRSPYYKLFWSAEQLAESVLKTSSLSPADVAAAVIRAMTAKRPRLREVVGRRAGLVLALRRHLWGEWFEKLYFGAQQRLIRKRMEKFLTSE
jgi:NAD(P)-dependent dehydrogenase (short-subunit alcohol dehydrogenase family)